MPGNRERRSQGGFRNGRHVEPRQSLEGPHQLKNEVLWNRETETVSHSATPSNAFPPPT